MKAIYILACVFGFLATLAHCHDVDRYRVFLESDPFFHDCSVNFEVTSVETEKRWSEIASAERINFITKYNSDAAIKEKAIDIENATRVYFMNRLRALGDKGVLFYFISIKGETEKRGYVRVEELVGSNKLTRSDFYIFSEMVEITDEEK